MCVFATHLQAQTTVSGSITSGATNAALSGDYSVQGAVGLPMVGVAGPNPIIASGFISQGNAVQRYYESTILRIDSVVKQIGDTFALDVRYDASCALFQSNVVSRNWELKVSFNRTVLEPLRYDDIVDDGERYTITLTGSAVSNGGVITRLLMMGRLGNDSTTDVRIESFRWLDLQRQFTQSSSGAVTLRGLCNTYGSTRLLKDPAKMAVMVAPNPVTGSSMSIRTYSEKATKGTLVITDIHGNEITMIDGVDASNIWPVTHVELRVIPAGTYTVTFLSGDEVVRTTMVKLP